MSDHPIRFAVSGCGRMGLAHTQRLISDERSTVVGLYDPQAASAEHLRNSLAPAAAVFSSFDAMLKETQPDAVVIATPTISHHDQILAAVDQNVDVLCEKPLAGNRETILRLIELSHQRDDRHLMIGYQRRCWTLYRRLREELQSGRHGAVQAITSVSAERWQQTIENTWRDDPEVNYGGFLGDAGSHKIDIIFYVTGLRPVEIFACSDRCGSRVEITTSVTARLEGGVSLTMAFVGNASSYHEELFIHCEKADLIVRGLDLYIGTDNRVQQIDLPGEESGPTSTRNPVSVFLDLLAEPEENIAPFECALPVFDLTTSILKSARQGRRITPASSRS